MALYYIAMVICIGQVILMAAGIVAYREDKTMRLLCSVLCVFFLLMMRVVWDGMVRPGNV